jgi:DNA-binding NarL/FixJ family response regulator
VAADRAGVIAVLLVDDHEVVRAGLSALLTTAADIEIVGTASHGGEALEQVARREPDVVLMDLSMPVMDGVTATETLTREYPNVRTLVLTTFADRARVRQAVAVGAAGYLLKDCTPTELLTAVRAAAAGNTPLDARVAGALLPARGEPPAAPVAVLSNREIEVLRLVSTGLANKSIARRLGIAERTVKVHLGHVFKRIGVSDRTSAALWAREHLD